MEFSSPDKPRRLAVCQSGKHPGLVRKVFRGMIIARGAKIWSFPRRINPAFGACQSGKRGRGGQAAGGRRLCYPFAGQAFG